MFCQKNIYIFNNKTLSIKGAMKPLINLDYTGKTSKETLANQEVVR